MVKVRTELDLVPSPTGWWECEWERPVADEGEMFGSMEVLASDWASATAVALTVMEPGQNLITLRYVGTYDEYQKNRDEDGSLFDIEDFHPDDEILVSDKGTLFVAT